MKFIFYKDGEEIELLESLIPAWVIQAMKENDLSFLEWQDSSSLVFRVTKEYRYC